MFEGEERWLDEMSYRLPRSEFRKHPWRIHEIAGDFHVEDVWQLPATEPMSSFRVLTTLISTTDPSDLGPLPVRFLWMARRKLGEWFNWDDPVDGTRGRVTSLAERLPADLREGTRTQDLFSELPVDVLIDLDDEFAAEIANKTVHGILHLGAIPTEDGFAQVQMTVLVKPNGMLGHAYLAAIKPFRYGIIYPTMIRTLASRWHEQAEVTQL